MPEIFEAGPLVAAILLEETPGAAFYFLRDSMSLS